MYIVADGQLLYTIHFPKMERDVGMTVPKTTETRYRDGSVQERQGIQLYKQVHHIPTFFLDNIFLSNLMA